MFTYLKCVSSADCQLWDELELIGKGVGVITAPKLVKLGCTVVIEDD